MIELSAKTHLIGIIGNPVRHSLSPLFQNFLIREMGLDLCYLAFAVVQNSLKSAIAGMRALGIAGLNVTAPYKEAVLPFVEKLSKEAQEIGAVNTIYCNGFELMGYNTDADGFLAPFDQRGINLKGRRVVILGAGGASAAVIFALLQRGAERITIFSRTYERAKRLVNRYSQDPHRLIPRELIDSRLRDEILKAEILVNATPVGGVVERNELPVPVDSLHTHLVVYDLVYWPRVTPLLTAAAERSACAISGLEMLVEQGARSLEIWTGTEIDVSLKERVIKHIEEKVSHESFALSDGR